jgi:DNA-binding NarL/FixJ family response regulator
MDPDPLARRALRTHLARQPDLELVGEARDASDGFGLVARHRPDLVLLAVASRDSQGGEAVGEIMRASPRTRVVVLALESDEDAQMELLRAGAAGWLLKSIDPGVLPRVLRGVHAGEAAVPRALCKRVLKDAIGPGRSDRVRLRPIRSSLTSREWEVIDLVAQGARTGEIAGALDVSQATVRSHLKHIFGKLGVHSRKEAVRHVEQLREVSAPLGG